MGSSGPKRADNGAMAASTHLLKSKDTYSRDALADILTTLADRIRTGTVKFDQGATSVDLGFPASVRLDVEIKETPKPTGTKHELELSMWWVTSPDGEPTPSGGIAIS